MLKEIHEQPETVAAAMRGRLRPAEGTARLEELNPLLAHLKKTGHLTLLSCGTSYYAGLYGRYLFEALTPLTVDVDVASEFRYRKIRFPADTAAVAISQSGETADTLAAVQEAKRAGTLTLGLVNVERSSIARAVDAAVPMRAGPEVGVASTKCFTSEGVILLLLALSLGRERGLGPAEGTRILRGLEALPDQLRAVLGQKEKIRALAEKYHKSSDFLFVGRKHNHPLAFEGALKLKEVSYIHAEAYPAGEMKHGPIAMIDADFPSLALAPQDETYDKMLSDIRELKTRGGKVIAVATEGDKKIGTLADDVLFIPPAVELISPLLAAVPLQLFAYYCAVARGCPVDRPRNLTKSVTAE